MQNSFWVNELDNSTDLLELKHTSYVILLGATVAEW